MSDDVMVVENDITTLSERNNQNSLLDMSSTDNILYLAERAEKYIEATNKIMTAALRITTEHDWILIGGTPYLQETGATKVARMFGISVALLGEPIVECDPQGYKRFTYRARFYLKDQFIECEGSRSMRDDFFAKTQNGLKHPDEIKERDVKMSAYTNCLNNGIKRLIPGLRNLDTKTLTDAGLDVSKINGYTFKTGSQGGNSGNAEDSGLVCNACGNAVSQKVASYSQSNYGKILCMDCQKSAKKKEG